MKNASFFNFAKISIFMLLNCFLILKKIVSLPYFQTLPTIKNRYYIVFSNGIMFFFFFINYYDLKYLFLPKQAITNEVELEKISFNNFYDDIENGLLIVKDYLYGLSLTGNIFCYEYLSKINGAISVVIPIKCNDDKKCYYVVALKNSNNYLVLNLYGNYTNSVSTTFNSKLLFFDEINLVSSDNINCHYKNNFICFYENDSNKIIAHYFDMDINIPSIKPLSSYGKENNDSIIIKSIISPDGSK